jgi:glycosyltransferase involved in cell wall biosynthesis
MKIAFIGQKGIPALSGGVEKHVENVAVRMAEAGHEVFVYVRSHYTNPTLTAYKGVHLVHIPSINTKNLEAITHTLFSTMHALFQTYDVIHYQSVGPSTLSFIPMFLTWNTKVVTTFHCQDSFHKKWSRFAKAYLRFGEYAACTFPDKTVVVSGALRDYAKEQYGCDANFIPNGADVEKNVGDDLLAEFGLKKQQYILSVGRLVKHKGVHYLINAFKKLDDAGNMPVGMKLVIVGKNAETPEYEESLKKISHEKNTILFLGERTGDTLKQLFAHASVFVQPSESEGMSIALLEAMGYGLPVVASDIEANTEVVVDTAIIFENKNEADLEKKLEFVLTHKDEAQALGKKAQARIAEHFSWDAIARKTVELYQSF